MHKPKILHYKKRKRHSKRGFWLIIEPHFDDACFSYAGTILAQRSQFDSVCILTVFSRSAYTVVKYIHTAPGELATEEISKLRKAEGLRFATAIQAKLEICDVPEALLRGYPMTSAVPRADDRDEICHRIQNVISTIIAKQSINRLSFPLGAASHLDHKIVGDTLLDFVVNNSSLLQHSEILAYRENPYAFDDPLSVSARLSYIEQRWSVTLTPVFQDTTQVMDKKLYLMGLFASQLSDEISKIEATERKEIEGRKTYREIAWQINNR